MRVISGKYGGRKLLGFKAGHIRPTSDRVKETIFNILRNDLEGAEVLDLFSGTGSLSIEALSRGAAFVTSVEKHPDSIGIERKNLQALGIKDGIKVFKDDVLRFLKKYKGKAFDVILIDPPFTEKMADQVMGELQGSAVWGPSSIIVIESSAHETIRDEYGALSCVDRRDFGDKMASFFKSRSDQCPDNPNQEDPTT